MSRDEQHGTPASAPRPRDDGPNPIVLMAPVDPRFEFGAMMGRERRATTRSRDPILRIATVIAFVLAVTSIVNSAEVLPSPVMPGACMFFLGACASGLYLLRSAITSRRRSREVHERFSGHGDEVRIVLGPEGCRWMGRMREISFAWPVVNEVFEVPRRLAPRAGLPTLPVADAVLPPELGREGLRARTADWREGRAS